ncbi:MAG TPA: hypothetical protein VK548_01985 [Candidatus Acidoferrum sp.]|nr:hypothetical protein [Candidatus Acidoferrum sp.]
MVDANASDEIRGDAGDVSTHSLTIRQGGARSVTAHDVSVRQGGIVRVDAHDVEVTQGGVGVATTGTLRLTAGGAWGVLADRATLDQSAVQVVAARERVDLDQAAAGIVAGGCVNVRDSAVGLLLTGRFEGQGVRVLLSPQAAFAFGAGAALVLSLFGLWRRRA